MDANPITSIIITFLLETRELMEESTFNGLGEISRLENRNYLWRTHEEIINNR